MHLSSSRKVTSLFEKKNENDVVEYILPLLTQPYDFKKNRCDLIIVNLDKGPYCQLTFLQL